MLFKRILLKLNYWLVITLILLLVINSCKKDEGDDLPPENEFGQLEKLNEFDLDVTEPSGLSFGPDGNTLLMVSDNTNKVYETDLQGNVIRELAYTGMDLEGVSFNPYEQIVAVAEERKRQVVFLDYTDGNEQERFDIATGGNTDNKGLEGISFNNKNSAYYIVNEDVPGEMIVWNKAFGAISTTELHFASDYSAIYVDTENALVYIVSDESQMLYKCDYNAKVLKKYPLPDTKFEGIAVDSDEQMVYLVNDRTAKLFVFKILN